MAKNNTNKQHVVRKSLISYLRDNFAMGYPWVHPVSKKVWRHYQIKEALEKLRELNDSGYTVLWALWTTNQTIEFTAQMLCCSTSVLKSRWENAVLLLLTLLMYPELNHEIPRYN